MKIKVVILTSSSMTKTINHTTFSGRCITGLDLRTNKIVRFVRNKFGAPIEYPYFCDYHKLDTVEVEVKEACPLSCQSENLLVNYHYPELLGKSDISIHELYRRFQHDNHVKKCFMSNNYNKLADVSLFNHSLEMIKVTNFVVTGNKCSFNYLSCYHSYYSLTDPDFKLNEHQSRTIGDAYLVISIPTDPWQGNYYKFVAAVYPLEEVLTTTPAKQDEEAQPATIKKNIIKRDCILQSGSSCRGNCIGCTSYYPAAKQ